jgi:hypothetical protein
MLEPVEDDKMGVTSGEDGQQALLCDESDPICRKLQNKHRISRREISSKF